jgi:hypothetical protein
VSLAIELESPRLGAIRQLAKLLRARAATPVGTPSLEQPAA